MEYQSPFKDRVIPNLTLDEYVLAAAREHGEAVALIDADDGRRLSCAALLTAVGEVASGLAARGIGRGDVVGIVAPNSIEYAVLFLAVAARGGVVTTANPLYTAGELRRQLEDARPRLVLTVSVCLDKVREAATELCETLLIDDDAGGGLGLTGLRSEGARPARASSGRATPDDLVALPYSSGTTGTPKGVMLSHRNLVSNIEQFLSVGHLGRDEVVLGLLPFFHIYGMVVVLLATLREGLPLVVAPRYDFEGMLETMEQHRVTVASLVPPILLRLAQDPVVDRFRLSLRLVCSGAAPLSRELSERCEARLGCRVRQGYGLTETSPVTHCAPLDFPRHGSVGPAVCNTRWRIVDPETGAALGPGERGEIRIKGPQVMRGYLNHEQASRDAFDEDGFYRTGDIGVADADATLTVVDRLKELIKVKGLQVAPAELEALLLAHPAVADAAVIGRPDDACGELPKAFVVRAPGAPAVTAEALMAYVAERVAPHKRVREVAFLDRIPKSASGKILRRELRGG